MLRLKIASMNKQSVKKNEKLIENKTLTKETPRGSSLGYVL